MSFYTIKNPQQRDKIIEEYLAVKNRIKKRSLDERMGELGRQEELNYVFSPVVKSNEETRSTIKESIEPVKEQIKTLNENILVNAVANRASQEDTDDQYFGFVRYKDKILMGRKEINLSEDKIIVDGKEYDLTAGLWSLINDKNPQGFTDNDWENYAMLVHQTDVINNPNNVTGKSRPKTTAKYRNFLKLLVDQEAAGKGIVNFLPSDINSLMQTLQVLVGEFAAGNKTTRNQIVAILDDLQRRNKISEGDYTRINTLLLR